jgi:hypothetical protein
MRSSRLQNTRAKDDNTIIMGEDEGDFKLFTTHDSRYLQDRHSCHSVAPYEDGNTGGLS